MTAAAQHSRFRSDDALWLAVAVVVTTLVFARSLPGELVYDDLLLIGRNPLITDLANIPSFFTRPYWDFLDPGSSEQIGYWRPLAAIAHTTAWWIGDGSPYAFHSISVLAHAAATAAAFFLVRRLVQVTWVAGAAALLFGLHPVHVESVAWISAINDPLAGLFTLLSVLWFLRWRLSGSRGQPILAAAFFVFALLSKETGVVVVPFCAALDLWRERGANEPRGMFGGFDRWRQAYGPFAAAIGLYVLARMFVFGSVFAGFDISPTHFGVDWVRLAQLRLELWGGSLELLAWPSKLNTFRPFRPTIPWNDPALVTALVTTTLAVGLFVALFLRRAQVALLALAFVPIGLAPALINVSALGRFPLSDRFLYVSVLGFTVLLALAARRFLPRRVAILGLLVVSGLYGWRSWDRIEVWHDEETLFEDAIAQSPRSAYVHWGLGRVLLRKVSKTQDARYLERAFATFEAAGDLLEEAKDPDTDLFVTSNDYLQTNLGLGLCYVLEAQDDGYGYGTAIAIFEDLARRLGEIMDKSRQARELGIRVIDHHLELERVYASLGSAHRLAGDFDLAEQALESALTLNPRCVEAQMAMGRLFAEREDWNVAVHHFEKALELQPRDFESKLALAQANREWGRRDRAEELALELAERETDQPEPLLILASLRLEDRDERAALVWIDRALNVAPENSHAWYFKGRAMESLGVNDQATIEAYRRATGLNPTNFEANYSFGNLLLRTGAVDAAAPFLVRAYAATEESRPMGALLRALSTEVKLTAPELFELSGIDMRRGRNDLAETWLDRALLSDPEHPAALFQKGRVLRRQERHAEALGLMRRSLENEPENFIGASELGQYLWGRGLLVEAERRFVECLALRQPANWNEDEFAAARATVQAMRDKVMAALPPSNTPPAPPHDG